MSGQIQAETKGTGLFTKLITDSGTNQAWIHRCRQWAPYGPTSTQLKPPDSHPGSFPLEQSVATPEASICDAGLTSPEWGRGPPLRGMNVTAAREMDCVRVPLCWSRVSQGRSQGLKGTCVSGRGRGGWGVGVGGVGHIVGVGGVGAGATAGVAVGGEWVWAAWEQVQQ